MSKQQDSLNPVMADSDIRLIESAKSNSKDFALLYDRYYPLIFNYIMRSVMHRQRAEDITSDTFLRVLHKISQYKPARGNFSAWIYQIATNVMRDYFRKNRSMINFNPENNHLQTGSYNLPEHHDPLQKIEEQELYQHLQHAIQQIKPTYRITIILYYFEQKTISEIALIMRVPQASVRWRLYRARTLLKAKLDRLGREQS